MKKTRAEKKLVDLRKGLEYERQSSTMKFEPNLATNDEMQNLKDTKQETVRFQSQSQSLYIYPVQLIGKDLTKTLVLCILAISLELGLYVLLEKPGLLPF